MPVAPPRPPMPPLNALRAFEAAARLGGFAAAAAEIGVTPGAVAQQIRKLELWLGAPLFERRAQGVALTAAAGEALPRLGEAFALLGQAGEALRQGGQPLTLAALPCIAQLWLSPRLPALRAALPGLDISLLAHEQPPSPRQGTHDLALYYAEAAPPGHDAVRLGEDALFPVCTPALARSLPSIAALGRTTLLHDAVWARDWGRWLALAGETRVDAMRGPRFSLYSMALEAALAGGGVLIGRRTLVAPLLADGRLVAPFAPVMPAPDALMLLIPRRKAHHARREAAVAWLRTAA